MIPLESFPLLNACLNASAGILAAAGFAFIRRGHRRAHAACMISACLVAALFLACYLHYHVHHGATPYPRRDWTRPAYFFILGSHTLLAAALVPMALVTLWRAARGRFGPHKALARWTFPAWMYVSVTGVLVYLMLYRR